MASTALTMTATLAVDGARLYYEVSGSGPVMVLIPGGAADCAIFSRLVPLLTDRYTVVTYDPRGISRSPRDDPDQTVSVQSQVMDAHLLLAEVTGEPAVVLGSGGGGITALELATHHPEQVHTVIAHEPPLIETVPDRVRLRAEVEQMFLIYRNEGVAPAMAKFLSFSGVGTLDRFAPEPGLDAGPAMLRMHGNLDMFLAHMLLPINRHVPELTAAWQVPTRILVGVGTESVGQIAHRTGRALAARLGAGLVEFPGDHAGFATDPVGFVRVLHAVLTSGR